MSEYHKPALLEESLSALNVKDSGIYLDATFGGGGHSQAILSRLKTGKLLAFDQDKDAEKNAKSLSENKNFVFNRVNFQFFDNFLNFYQISKVDGILADLGVSWHQFDSAQRGFSFRFNGKIDMRMNQNSEKNAEKILQTYSTEKLTQIFSEFGEIRNAYQVAKSIAKFQQQRKISTIENLLEAVKNCVPQRENHHFLAQMFQALRIEVNNEMGNLKRFLEKTTHFLKPQGRLVIISYHSLEDRIVKNFMKTGNVDGEVKKDFFGNILCPLKMINKKPIIPTEAQVVENNRIRSAKLRIAELI